MNGDVDNSGHGGVNRDSTTSITHNGLQNKVTIVTGASSGIGRAPSLTYAAEGAKVVAADRAAISASESEADISSSDLIVQRGGLDILVNNAGVAPEITDPRPVWETTDKTWNTTIGVNSNGVFNGIRAVSAQMMRHEPHSSGDRGWIISLSSIYRQVAIARSGEYSNLTRSAGKKH